MKSWKKNLILTLVAGGVLTISSAPLIAQPIETSTTRPAVKPTRPSDAESAAAFDSFNQVNALAREGKLDEAVKLLYLRKDADVAQTKKMLSGIAEQQKEGRQFLTIDAKAVEGVATLLIGQKDGEGAIESIEEVGAVKADGIWKVMIEEAEEYSQGELTDAQKKTFEALKKWADERRKALLADDD